MITFLCVVVIISFFGSIDNHEFNKEAGVNSTIVCVASIAALTFISIFKI